MLISNILHSQVSPDHNNVNSNTPVNEVKIYHNSDTDKVLILFENKGKAGVYRWINKITGEFYIGSSINLSKRLQFYYQYSYISSTRYNSRINFSILKYGYSQFSVEILEYCDKSKVIEREQYYIDTLNPSLNILAIAGNVTGRIFSEETKKKMSEAKIGKYIGENNPMFGKNHNEETISQIKQTLRDTKQYNAVAVILTDENHKFIQEFPSVTALCDNLGASRTTIRRYIKSEKLFIGKYYIKLKKDDDLI